MTVWIVVGLGVVSTAVVLAAVLLLSAAQTRRDDRVAAALRADLLAWAGRNGWAEADPPPELTVGRLHEVMPGERRRVALAGTLGGLPAALAWCEWSNEDATHRYVSVLVRLPHSYSALRIRQRKLKIQTFADPTAGRLLTEPVRAALLRLRSVTGRHDEFVRLDGPVLRVVMGTWPRPETVAALLAATADVVAALPTTDTGSEAIQ